MPDSEVLLKVIIVDDEPEACRNLSSILLDFVDPNITIAGVAHSAAEAEKLIAAHKPDAVFLDIEMPNENAFHFLKRISPVSFEIVFVTAYDEYAVRAFKLNAVDYILKPISINELSIAVARLRDRVRFTRILNAADDRSKPEDDFDVLTPKMGKITLRENNIVEVVRFEEIVYVEASGGYSKVYFMKDKEQLHMTTSYSIADYEELLPEEMFYRVHKSYLINSMYIVRIYRDEALSLTLYPSVEVPVSRRRIGPLLEFLKTQNTL